MTAGVQSLARIPELQQRILFAFAMLGVYRVGCAVVTPGINTQRDQDIEHSIGALFRNFKNRGSMAGSIRVAFDADVFVRLALQQVHDLDQAGHRLFAQLGLAGFEKNVTQSHHNSAFGLAQLKIFQLTAQIICLFEGKIGLAASQLRGGCARGGQGLGLFGLLYGLHGATR